MIFTTYYGKLPSLEDSKREKYAISRVVPKNIKVEQLKELAPSPELLKAFRDGKIDIEKYKEVYDKETLSILDANGLYKKYDNSFFVCYEKPNEFCHRILIRKWLAKHNKLALEYKTKYKIAIVGSRGYNNKAECFGILNKFLSRFDSDQEISFVSGGADGADSLAKQYADNNNIDIEEITPEWDKYGKAAGYARNKNIWKHADFGIAFWDGESKGTRHSFDISKKLYKILIVYNYVEKKFYILNFERYNIKTSLF